VRVLRAADYRRTAWKNGGGVSRQIAVFPPHAGYAAVDWRISRSRITTDSPFSSSRNLDRQIILVSGDGFELHCRSDSDAVDFVQRIDTPLEPFAFRGDWDTECRLLGGEIEVFNLMTRRGRAAGTLEIRGLRGMTTVSKPKRQQLVLWIARGALDVYGAWGQATLYAEDSVLVETEDPTEIAVTPTASQRAIVILVRLDRLN
jgi:environmental stress-induced protein Ves